MPTVAVIVVAAGEGSRLEAGVPKAFAELRGRTILERALDGIHQSVEQAQVVIVAPKSHLKQAQRLAADATVVAGGATRQDSVAAGLAVLDADVQTVLVHDAARALCPGELFDRVARAVVATGAGVIPALPVTDTIKRVADEQVLDTVDRSSLVHVQTPQGFPKDALIAAYANAAQEYTDDAALFQAAGGAVSTVPGEARAFKITVPWDMRRAENLLGATSQVRTGIGMDVHRFDESAPLWLGGLYWPDEPGLAGHSDGDALAHAICDALLAAAGLGDIGGRFGTDDPRFADAHGELFITETVALVQGAGFTVGNVAVQLIGNRPKVGPRRGELERHLTALVGAPVSVSATTSDGLGFTGEGQGVVAIANALVRATGSL
jgi:2-C-methyl-D-erythritol 4-phosphate cytidylyltransferase/2-C-methyl-D-erythritol 2,4-cyclodiphosphate synthase